MGTRFMATKECLIHDNAKDWILKALAGDTVIVERSLGNSMRVARTSGERHGGFSIWKRTEQALRSY